MGDESFSEELLKEKLTKLNSSQQSIESLSKWCVDHQKNATQIVETWESLFNSAAHDLRVSLLYLSNDILQNSRRKGSEFVNEFWEVLPAAIKDAYDTGDENCRKVASRLVDIWEERNVFGNRGQNLKSKVLGDNLAPVNNAKNSNLIRVEKRDANSVQFKLAVGGLPEKILTSIHKLHYQTVGEETALDKCHNAITSLQEIEKDAANASSQGGANVSCVVDNMRKHEDVIRHTISQLQKSEEIRLALISQLKEALQDQETKLELIQSELLAAQSKLEQLAKIKLQLTSTSSTPPFASHSTSEPNTDNTTMSPSTNPSTPLTNPNQQGSIRKAVVASIAAKLAASVCSAQLDMSFLSTFASEEEEEEATSESIGVKRPKLDPSPFSTLASEEGEDASSESIGAKRPKLDPTPFSDAENSDGSNNSASPFLQPPPPPSAPALVNQSVESNIMERPYNYVASNLSPEPPLSSDPTVSFAGPGIPPQPSNSPTRK